MPWAVLALWVAVIALAVPFAAKLADVTRDDAVDYLPGSADSTRVQKLVEDLPGGDTVDIILVHHREAGLTAADRELAREQVAEIAGEYELKGDATPQVVPSEDGTALMTVMSITGESGEERRIEAATGIRDGLGDAPEGLSVEVGGAGALEADMDAVFESIDGTLMYGTAAVVAILLILTYRSPFLWLVPLVVVGAATFTSQAVTYALVQAFDLTVTGLSSGVMTILIFGAGTDYALLLVARYREELRRIERPYDAMAAALRGCGPAILASAGTVTLGLLCLLVADMNSSNGLGPVGAVGVVCALVAMMTLLPAILVLLGRGVFWPLVPRHGAEPSQRRSLFAVMGTSASRRPATVLITGMAVLGALAIGMLNLPGTPAQEDTFTNKPESISAMETVGEAYPGSNSQPITVMAKSDAADTVLAEASRTPGVADVEKGRSGDGWTEISVFAEDRPESAGEKETVRTLRADLHALEGAEALVGGDTAQRIDEADTNSDDRWKVIPLVLVVVLLVLIALLRSLTAPLVLIVAVAASWGAAMGIGGLVFEPVFGFSGVDASLPLLAFVFLVALGVDYGIFLMHRMREESLKGLEVPDAALKALRTTGGVIASAGIVLAATFSVLATMPMVLMAELGFIIAIGVLLDTFVVRTYLVTSASLLLKRWVWWPGRLFHTQGTRTGPRGGPRASEAPDGVPDERPVATRQEVG
ncbi:MMPL family transporter [Streptomyces sp. N2-109]|uniref:MMPL family transporter n=1 Tax=Streptomyces gossypii TaxID=2883101 RepID=A0ABT2JS94_9ACTN|nr:MMPL family transporter [Streptomyces gossypii]MCT2590359.1 MMPL family transporter [Streptomyces gossypii]